MKKLIVLLFIFSFSFVFSQEDVYFGKKASIPVEIIMENGEVKTGFLQNFQNPKYVYADMLLLGNIEKKLRFEIDEFNFKEEQSSAVEKIGINDLKRIVILGKDGSEKLVYDKMKLKTINVKGEILDVKKTVVLPLEQEGKTNLYGINIVFVQNNRYNNNIYLPYMKKADEEYGYIVIDLNRVNFFNLGKIDDKLKKAIYEVTKDCAPFSDNLDVRIKEFEDDVKTARKEGFAKKKELRKIAKNGGEGFDAMKIDHEYSSMPYRELLDEYEQKCKK
ncbi:hypothetical protein K0U91_09175 [Chryseobacterium chendengshani]|uniref:hypothetical protein n=1 Tax=Chryseobacterium sp. LJ668 TaxID=2864040 RepID=UPI001C693050|nr:hypothetical protein [Chryseobacterium sp. LJ668]MBW8524510.1 hypothetical protein [Chryseobacterium sp. LJ668]QYK15248.1 hypothetical protein K0U91_09175 [Chryseobacterium sp. LJ668]